MKKQEYLDIVTRQVRYIFDREFIEAELKEHLEDSIQDLMEDGFSYEEAEEQAVEDTALFQMRQRISDLLSGLSEKDQRLLSLRFGLDGGKPMSPEEVGVRLGLTPEEVVAAEAAALARLRNG